MLRMNSSISSEVKASGISESLEPCSIIIFGASGGLTARKLIPALYRIFKDKRMPSAFRIIGFARREKTDETWRTELRTALDQFSRTKPVDNAVWAEFSKEYFLLYRRHDGYGGVHQTGTAIKFVLAIRNSGKTFCFISPPNPASSVSSPNNCTMQNYCRRKMAWPVAVASSSKNRSAMISFPRRR